MSTLVGHVIRYLPTFKTLPQISDVRIVVGSELTPPFLKTPTLDQLMFGVCVKLAGYFPTL